MEKLVIFRLLLLPVGGVGVGSGASAVFLHPKTVKLIPVTVLAMMKSRLEIIFLLRFSFLHFSFYLIWVMGVLLKLK
ncbi:hypothetical protein [Pedobacter sp. ASV28]|uniref:hypothetical protein n=1 Tax=Pedobacter sp. ASV28 TaxID=2795123 RepID=UPI001E359E71|nr:hypothetical protein [Pedobacter sp. ASV28]